ncbi:MAG: alkaline phosphatase family protein [Nitrososphaerota archaeon]
MMGSRKKIVVIGLCGASFDIINKLIEEDKLPTIEELIKDGVVGLLKSEFPPITPVNWASFMTGKNPGKHGIFDYEIISRDGNKKVVDSTCIRSKTLWKILSDFNKKVGIVHVPLTYPPEKVNGFVVPGYVLSQEKTDTYPPELEEELKEKVPGFDKRWLRIKWYAPGREQAFIKSMWDITRIEEKVTLYLMKNYEWDFFISVFFFLDEVQHYLWKFYTDPSYSKDQIKDAIPRFYELLDSILHNILEEVDDNTIIMVLSDHGFGPLRKIVFINHYLWDLGLLKLKRSIPTLTRYLSSKLKSMLKLPFDYPRLLRLSLSDVDFKRTVAYSTGYVGKIYINKSLVKTEEICRVVRDYIIAKLQELKDPESGIKLVSKILKKEDLYHGSHVDEAPDLLFEMMNLSYITRGGGASGGGSIEFGFDLNTITAPPFNSQSGWHREEGFLIIKGAGIKKGVKIEKVSIRDLAPTILYLLGVPIPSDMDGRVLQEIFEC